MPFTPLHLGPALLVGLIIYRYIDLPTLLIATVIVDIRTALVYFGVLEGPLHGFLHTFLGGTVLVFLMIGAITPFRKLLQEKMDEKGFLQTHDDGTIVSAAFLGVYLHLLLDATIYTDMTPLWPLVENPFLNTVATSDIYAVCMVAGIISLGIIPWRLEIQRNRKKNRKEIEIEDSDE